MLLKYNISRAIGRGVDFGIDRIISDEEQNYDLDLQGQRQAYIAVWFYMNHA